MAEESHTSAVVEQKRAPAVAGIQNALVVAEDQISLVAVVQSALAVAGHND